MTRRISVSRIRAGSPLKKGTVPVGTIDLLRRIHSLERDSPLFQLPACASIAVLLTTAFVGAGSSCGQEPSPVRDPAADSRAADEQTFREVVQPLFEKYCVRCHNADKRKSGIRVDQLNGSPEDRHLPLWKNILKQIDDEAMPPEDEPQPTAAERQALREWIPRVMNAALARNTAKNGSVRRLTVSQYGNTLKDLLGLEDDLTEALPPDGISKDGFANNGQTLLLSPLQVEAYFDIAEKALDLCIVDEHAKPVIQNFRMDLGQTINPQPCPDKLVLGANSFLLNNADFVVTELKPDKPFGYQPFAMQTKFDFIEGYVGNDTIREWRKFDSIYHAVFACMRGSPGYPKGEAFQVVPTGLLLRPAIPSSEIFGVSNTYGPMANFKISLRELSYHGNFRVTVKAARYEDGLLLDAGAPVQAKSDTGSIMVTGLAEAPTATVNVAEAGIYQVDVYRGPGDFKGGLTLELADRHFAGQVYDSKSSPAPNDGDAAAVGRPSAFLLARLPVGELKMTARYGDNARLRRIAFSRIPEDSELAQRFKTFEQRTPSLGVYLGLRRDCGSTLTRVREPQAVASADLQEFVFEGPINNFPTPDVEKDNVNYLAGVREIGVRSEYTDGRDMPRLLVRSVEFEGPYYSAWPPATHRNIFIESSRKDDLAAYAGEIIRSIATRAFRRPCTDAEQAAIFAVWQTSYRDKADFRQSIKDALLVVLTSPQFLFLIENSAGPEPEDLDDYELASKLSYFLWNTAPDRRLLDLAANHGLHGALDSEVGRMIGDPRFGMFLQEFASQWLSLDKLDVVAVDGKRFPRLTRDARSHLRQEPVQFLRYVIEHNLPLRNLIQSDFVMADEVVANYYNLADRTESGFQFVPIKHENENLGGILAQAGILAGLSDGRESNPVKRGAWFARRIIAEPPDDPPPNVPKLPEDDGAQLTLRQKLERHRNQEGCAKCHAGIDPWGMPFEKYDAAGLFKKDPVDARSKLPDGTEVADLRGLKAYLVRDRIDQVAFSFLKHIACYAAGRSLTYNELVFLRKECIKLREYDYRMQELIRFVVKSDLFLKK
jgi:hypothetical protein